MPASVAHEMAVMTGPAMRLTHVQRAHGHIPPHTVTNLKGETYHACGSCFRKLGNLPPSGLPERMSPGVPRGAICAFCGRYADRPADPVDIRW